MRPSVKRHVGGPGRCLSALFLRLRPSEAPPLHRAQPLLWTSALTFVSNNRALPVSLLVTGAPFLDGSPPALGWTEYLSWCCLWRPMCRLPRPRPQGQPFPAGHHPPSLSTLSPLMIKATHVHYRDRENKGKQNREDKKSSYSLCTEIPHLCTNI